MCNVGVNEEIINTKIKICGLRTADDVEYVNQCKPDYVGFVFADSRRRVTGEQAAELRAGLLENIVPVGVFVNAPADEVAEIVNRGIIDIAQLHGDEDAIYIKELRGKLKRGQIIKAVRVRDMADIEVSRSIDADYILFDTYKVGAYGGTGDVFDWKLLRGYSKPFFLAGGINEQNVMEAVRLTKPYAVDVSSAVETDGRKDGKKIREFIDIVRGNIL